MKAVLLDASTLLWAGFNSEKLTPRMRARKPQDGW